MNKEYIFAFDLSLSSSGICVFDKEGNPLEVLSIQTYSKRNKQKMEHKDRLKLIADELLNLRDRYNVHLIVLESGFSRHAASTEAIFECFGLVRYLFCDCQQVTLAPSSVKKIITGDGRSEKDIVQQKILERYPNFTFKNFDESDAMGVGLAYFSTISL